MDHVPGAEVVEEEEEEEDDNADKMEEDGDGEEEQDDENTPPEEKMLSMEAKKTKAREMTLTKILTDEDFKKIDAANLKKQVSVL